MLVFYSLDIFRRANVQMNNYMVSILVQSGVTGGYFISSFLMSRLPRKLHFIAAGLFMATNLLAAGIILQVEVRQIDFTLIETTIIVTCI